MNFAGPNARLVALTGLLLAFSLAANAQQTPNLPTAAPRSTVLTNPPVPILKSPLDVFRELLSQTPEERSRSLASRPPEVRQRLQAKIREYQALPPEDRELRLRATELRWYLLPLMRLSATNRTARLAAIPPEMRKLVEDRLRLWDILPPPLPRELLENEQAISHFMQLGSGGAEAQEKLLAEIPVARREQLEAGIARWQQMPEKQRREICDRFNQFFDLTPLEKDKALKALSLAERQQMEKTLSAFEKLSNEQRAACIRSFTKFATMGLAERQQFLQNAGRWETMSLAERAAWRSLVSRVPALPPSPPGTNRSNRSTSPPLPPPSPAPGTSVATNGP